MEVVQLLFFLFTGCLFWLTPKLKEISIFSTKKDRGERLNPRIPYILVEILNSESYISRTDGVVSCKKNKKELCYVIRANIF
jgi:hypothetical protein